MNNVIFIMFTLILAESLIFHNFPGKGHTKRTTISLSASFVMGMCTTFIISASSAVSYGIYNKIPLPLRIDYLYLIPSMTVTATAIILTALFIKRYMPAFYTVLEMRMQIISISLSMLTFVIMRMKEDLTLLSCVGFGFISGLAFTLMLIVIAGIGKRLDFADPPEAFRGIPLMLLAAAFAAMAFSGFIGLNFR